MDLLDGDSDIYGDLKLDLPADLDTSVSADQFDNDAFFSDFDMDVFEEFNLSEFKNFKPKLKNSFNLG